MSDIEAWLRGPIEHIAPVLQPVAHALVQASEDVERLAPSLGPDVLWARHGAATAGFHLVHMAGALDRLFTYARGEMLNDAQKQALRAETADAALDGRQLAAIVADGVAKALAQLRATDTNTLFEERRVGRSASSTHLGLLFHAAEHTARHAGQFITTVKIVTSPAD